MKKKDKEVKMILSGKACKTTCLVLSIFAKIAEVLFIIVAIASGIAGVLIGMGQKEINVNEMIAEIQTEMDKSAVTVTGPAIDNFLAKSHGEQIAFILIVMAVVAIIFAFMSVLARYVYLFFKHLTHDRTPFKLKNVDLLQKIALWLFVSIATIDLSSLVLSLMLGGETFGVNISLSNYALGFVILVLAVVFRHGYELEQKTKK